MPTARTLVVMFALAGAIALLVLLAAAMPIGSVDPELTLDGPDNGALLNADGAEEAAFTAGVDIDDAIGEVRLFLGDEDITGQATQDGRTLVWSPDDLDDDDYEFSATLDEQRLAREFSIDTVAPALSIDEPEGPVMGDEEYELTGAVDDPDATVEVAGGAATVDGDRFTATLNPDTSEPVVVTATDEAGNRSSDEVELTWIPSRVTVDQVRSVHVSFHGWVTDSKREPIMEMIEAGLINSVQLDLKDESGMVGYDTQVELAQEAGAVGDYFDLEEEVALLHEMGVHVSGRIVAFADPVLSRHEWENGDRDRVIQTADGEFYTGRYAGFINFANEDVRQYNIDIAVEAARAGIDDILWDYVRRPDGSVDKFNFPGLGDTEPVESIASFVAAADEAIAPYGVEHGASLYGIAVDRPHEIAQDVDVIARHVDYVSPMLYPSHWGPGEYGVANPNAQPYEIIHASLGDWVEKVETHRARVVPWLQDFSLGHPYGVAEVKAQIDAAADVGVEEWMLWNAGMNYTPDALPPAPGADDS